MTEPSTIVSALESILELAKEATGSWSSGIALAAVAFRVVTFPVYSQALKKLMVRARVQSELSAIYPRTEYPKSSLAEQTRIQSEYMLKMREAGLAGTALEGYGFFLFVSAPWTIGNLMALGQMARDEFLNPMFVKRSPALWMDSMALPDPSGILPLALAAVSYRLLRNPVAALEGSISAPGATSGGLVFTLLKGAALASVPTFCLLPAGCCEFLIANHLSIIACRSIVLRGLQKSGLKVS